MLNVRLVDNFELLFGEFKGLAIQNKIGKNKKIVLP